MTDDARQWRDIAYCLALLPFKSERSLKKLIEGLPFYRDKLHDQTVFGYFSEILTKARANKSASKPDTELNEFESVGRVFSVVCGGGTGLTVGIDFGGTSEAGGGGPGV